MAFVQTLGFPIAAAVAVGIVFYKILLRVMDENKQREENYQKLLVAYGEKMGEISQALAEIKGDICEMRGYGVGDK